MANDSVVFTESERPVSSLELDALESKYNFKFPAQYRAFLLEHNGGRPDRTRFRFLHFTAPYSDSLVDWFLAVYDGKYDNFENTFRMLKVERARLPARLVPIANDPFGNQICISVSGDDIGAIYFWDHEREPDPNSVLDVVWDNIFLIAHSFEEFLAALK